MKKKASRPISARPRIGPTTAPAIQALLLLFSGVTTSGTTGSDGELAAAVELVAVDDKVVDAEAETGTVIPGGLGQYEHQSRDEEHVLDNDAVTALAGRAR
jgi:hypothetical protein